MTMTRTAAGLLTLTLTALWLPLGLGPASAAPPVGAPLAEVLPPATAPQAAEKGAPAGVLAPLELMKAKTAELKAMLTQPQSRERTLRVKQLADSLIVYAELSRLSLGEKQWSTLADGQRREFVDLLQQLIEKNYIEQAEKNPEFQVEWLRQEMGKLGDRARVMSLASAKGNEVELEYRLLLQAGRWIVYDLLIDGVSVTRSYNKTFSRIIAKDGWNGLIQRMKKKLAGAQDDELERAAVEERGSSPTKVPPATIGPDRSPKGAPAKHR